MFALIPDLTPAPFAHDCVHYLTNQSGMSLLILYLVNLDVLAELLYWRDLMRAAFASGGL